MIENISFGQFGLWMSIAFLVYALHLKREANEIAKQAAKEAGKPQATIISPQPLLVEMQKQFATKEELEGLKKDMDGRFDKIDSKLDDRLTTLDNKRDRQISDLHEKVNEVSSMVSYIKGKMDCQAEDRK